MRQTVIPQLRIIDADRSRAFYVEYLGFVVDWEHRFGHGYPVFLPLTRQGQTIFLTQHTSDCEPGGAVYFIVPDADRCLAEFKAKGIQPTKDVTDMPWGAREFLLTDPDGNRLRFAIHSEA